MKPETIFYRSRVKPFLLKHSIEYERMETGGTALGIPDLYAYKNGGSLWIELKICRVKNNIIAPNWQPGQIFKGRKFIRQKINWIVLVLLIDKKHDGEIVYFEYPYKKYRYAQAKNLAQLSLFFA